MMLVAKARLLVVVVLFLIASCDAKLPTDFERDTSVGLVNFIRMAFAQKAKIANMHALSWDKGLADEVEREVKQLEAANCDVTKSDGKEYQGDGRPAAFFEQDDVMEKVGEETWKELQNGEWPDVMFKFLGWELFLHPLQTKFGCAEVKCSIPVPNTSYSMKLKAICLMGPKKTFERTDYEEGEPGSECGSAKAESGLCVASGQKVNVNKNMKEDEAMAKFGAKGDLGLDVAKLKQKSDSRIVSAIFPSIVISLIVLALRVAF